jgi:hypothetical protein
MRQLGQVDAARTPLSIDGAYPGEFAKARLGIAAQDGSTGLRRVGGDDQVVCATRETGSADMSEQGVRDPTRLTIMDFRPA